MSFIKFFLKEYIISDDQSILVDFFFEIVTNISNNCLSPDTFDELMINSMIENFKKDFKINMDK